MNRPPLWFIPLIIFSVLLGIYISPELLIQLGPLRQSLTSDIASVKQIAYLEVSVLRGLSLGFAALLTILWLTWKPLQQSRLIQYLQQIPDEIAAFKAIDHPFNRAFWVMLAATTITVTYIGLAPFIVSEETMLDLIREDGFIEAASALILILTSAYTFKLALKGRQPYLLQKITLLGFAVLFFLMAGEEISWGQRIFDIATPESLKQLNVQGEINLHNMLGYFFDHIFIMAIFTYGFILPMLAHYYPIFAKTARRIGIPVATMGLAWGFLMVSSLHEWTVFRVLPPIDEFAIAELREFLTDIALFLLIYQHRLRVA